MSAAQRQVHNHIVQKVCVRVVIGAWQHWKAAKCLLADGKARQGDASCAVADEEDAEWDIPLDEPPVDSGPLQVVQFYKYGSTWTSSLLVKAFPVGRRVAMRGRLTPQRNGTPCIRLSASCGMLHGLVGGSLYMASLWPSSRL
jgi:hypothetical protein